MYDAIFNVCYLPLFLQAITVDVYYSRFGFGIML